MKIALCSSYVPFINGGARNIVDWLQVSLSSAGHEVEIIYLPFIDHPDVILSQTVAYRSIDLSDSADCVISFRPPAHLIKHPNKILWFIHHVRLFYDLWDHPYRSFPADAKHCAIRDLLHSADTQGLVEAKSIFTNSQVVSNRLLRFNGIQSEVLYPPILDSHKFFCRGFSDEVLYLSRIEHHKRQHLLIEAMRYTRTAVKLRISGVASNADYAMQLRSMIASYGLGERVHFDNRWISEDEKLTLLSDCLAVAYLPVDEDSYGYPSLEAFHSLKPVLTTTDSGGVLELVENGVSGIVVEPDAKALADALDNLFSNRRMTISMGSNAVNRIHQLQISWSHVLEKLLA